MMTFLVTGTASRPGPFVDFVRPAGLCLIKADGLHPWLLLMSLALLTLFCARPIQAQTPGRWQFDHFECNGVSSGSGGRFTGGLPWSYTWPSTSTFNSIGDAYGDADLSNISVTVTPFFRWVPGSNSSASPSILYAKITSAAYAGDDKGNITPSANNGFGDVSNQPPPGYEYIDASSIGTHLEQKDPQGQTLVSLPPQTLSADGGFANDWRTISTKVNYQVDTDNKNRAVTISSTLGQTYHKGSATTDNGSPQPVPDVPDADGTIHANTLKPGPYPQNIDITYSANPVGACTPLTLSVRGLRTPPTTGTSFKARRQTTPVEHSQCRAIHLIPN